MPETRFDQMAVREWLELAIKVSGLSPNGLAIKAGVSPSTITRSLSGRARHSPTWRTISKIAAAAGIAPTPGGSAFTAFPAERQTTDSPGPGVEGATPREVPPDPHSRMFLFFVDLFENVSRLQALVLAVQEAYPEATGFSGILTKIFEMQNLLSALTLQQGINESDVLQTLLLKHAKAILAVNPEFGVGDRPQRSGKTAA
jgi:transcriptional regulator with XRE-family HTH domain